MEDEDINDELRRRGLALLDDIDETHTGDELR